jgi:putative transposase
MAVEFAGTSSLPKAAVDAALSLQLISPEIDWPASSFLDRSLLENSALAARLIRAVGRGRTMKRSKFTEAQIAFILRQAEEGTAVGEVCRKAGISEATFYNWRRKYAVLMPLEMKRLRQLEEENGKLKKIVGRPVARQGDTARRDPPKVLRPARQRQIVDYARVRYGYRRIHVLLHREGWQGNAKCVYRLYREMRLQLRTKTPKRRVRAKLREDRRLPTRSNETGAMDFVHDQLATGPKLRADAHWHVLPLLAGNWTAL